MFPNVLVVTGQKGNNSQSKQHALPSLLGMPANTANFHPNDNENKIFVIGLQLLLLLLLLWFCSSLCTRVNDRNIQVLNIIIKIYTVFQNDLTNAITFVL